MKLSNSAPLTSVILLLAGGLHAQSIVQTEADYLAVPATSYSSTSGQWAAFTDDTTSPSFSDQVMIFGDSLGVDASNANVPLGVSSVDTLTYTLDFTSAGDYSLFVRVQGEFSGSSENDSFFYAKSFGGPSTSSANSLAPGSNLSTDYAWVRLTYDADASVIPAPGSGVESYSPSSSADWLPLTIDSTQAASGNTVTYTIAGRERDLQLDLIVFHTNPSITAAELDALFVTGPGDAATDALSLLVEALPESTPDEQVKKAVLQVAVERAINAHEVSLIAEKERIISDVEGALSQAASDFTALNPGAPTHLPILLPLITPYGDNPYLQELVLEATGELAVDDVPWPRALDYNDTISGSGAYGARAAAKLMGTYFWLFGHEDSPMKFDPELLKRVLRRAHAYFDSYELEPDIYADPTPNWVDQFAISSAFPALWEIRSLYPGLLLPGQLDRWDTIMGDLAISFVNYDPLGFNYNPWNINIETARSTGGLVAALWTDNSWLEDRVYDHMDRTTARVLPDGALPYHGLGNPSVNYHNEMTDLYITLYGLTGYETLLDALVNMQWKGPVMGRTDEFWTSPFHKTYRWNYEDGTEAGNEAVATLSGNPYLRGLLDRDTDRFSGTNLINAIWYDANGVDPEPLPDNYTIPDRNVGGPRAWYGEFNYAGAFRPNPPGTSYEGHETFMGAMTVDPADGRLNSILTDITPRIWQTPDPTDTLSAWADLSINEVPATTISQDYSVSTSIHEITRRRSDAYRTSAVSGWTARQMWIGMEDRIVGLVSTVPTGSSAAAYAVNGVLRLISGGTAGAATTKVLQVITPNAHYRYGQLDIFVHDTTYTSLTGFEVPYRVPSYPATELTFSDRASEPLPVGSQSTFPSNTDYRFVVEVRPIWTTTDLTEVNVLGDQDVIGLEVIGSDQSLQVWLNAASTTQSVTLHRESLPTGEDSFVLSDGVLGRVPFNPNVPSSVNLDPGQHAVLVVSADSDDHGIGFESLVQLIESTTHSPVTVIQTNPDYLVFDAASYASGTPAWSVLTDKTTSPSIADEVMVYLDTDGVDASSSNLVGTNSDTLAWTMDFTHADEYSMFIRVQGEFGGNALNDSLFIAKDWDTAPTAIANSLGSDSLAVDYQWVRISDTTSGAPLGSGVGSYSFSGSFGALTIDGTQALLGNTVTYSIAGREQDLQVDQIAFHTNPSISAAELDALAALAPEPFLSINQVGGGLQIHYQGTLQESSDLDSWTDMDPQPASPLTITLAPGEKRFFQVKP